MLSLQKRKNSLSRFTERDADSKCSIKFDFNLDLKNDTSDRNWETIL